VSRSTSRTWWQVLLLRPKNYEERCGTCRGTGLVFSEEERRERRKPTQVRPLEPLPNDYEDLLEILRGSGDEQRVHRVVHKIWARADERAIRPLLKQATSYHTDNPKPIVELLARVLKNHIATAATDDLCILCHEETNAGRIEHLTPIAFEEVTRRMAQEGFKGTLRDYRLHKLSQKG